MDRQSDGLRLVRQGSLNCLFDPPRGVRGKLRPFGGIKPFDPFHQTDIAFIDQVKQRQTQSAVVARDLHDQSQIGFDHLLARLLVTLLNAPGKHDFFFRREELYLANLAQIKLQCITAGHRRINRFDALNLILNSHQRGAWKQGCRELDRVSKTWSSEAGASR